MSHNNRVGWELNVLTNSQHLKHDPHFILGSPWIKRHRSATFIQNYCYTEKPEQPTIQSFWYGNRGQCKYSLDIRSAFIYSAVQCRHVPAM